MVQNVVKAWRQYNSSLKKSMAKAMPRCHRELFSSFCALPFSVFLALQQRSDPPTPSTCPAAQLSRVEVTGFLSLLREGQ